MKISDLSDLVFKEKKLTYVEHKMEDCYNSITLQYAVDLINSGQYEYVDFRLPFLGESFISKYGRSVFEYEEGDEYFIPKIIVRRVHRKKYIFVETGEYRCLEYGEYGINVWGEVFAWGSQTPSYAEYKALRQVVEEEV